MKGLPEIPKCYGGTFRIWRLLNPEFPDAIPMGSLLRIYHKGVPWFDGVFSGFYQPEDRRRKNVLDFELRFLTEKGEEAVNPRDVSDMDLLHRY